MSVKSDSLCLMINIFSGFFSSDPTYVPDVESNDTDGLANCIIPTTLGEVLAALEPFKDGRNRTRKYMHAETLALLTKPLYFPNMKYLK
jgi:hypothetical protein